MAHFCPNMPMGVRKTGKKENLQADQKWASACNFCEPNFQEFRLKWWRKELFLHCGDELNGLGTSWMGLILGNVIVVILGPLAFQKYSICWVFQAFFCSTFYMCFPTRPSPSPTAVVRDIFISFDRYIFIDIFSQSFKSSSTILLPGTSPCDCT